MFRGYRQGTEGEGGVAFGHGTAYLTPIQTVPTAILFAGGLHHCVAKDIFELTKDISKEVRVRVTKLEHKVR